MAKFVEVVGADASGTGTILDASAPLNLLGGDLLIAWAKHEDASTTIAVAGRGGDPGPLNQFTADGSDYVAHTPNCGFAYLLSATQHPVFIPRLTLGATRTFRGLRVLQFSPAPGMRFVKSASNVVSDDVRPYETAGISPSGPGLAVGAVGQFATIDCTTEQINGVAADAVVGESGQVSLWYRILSSGFTNGIASCTSTADIESVVGVIAFQEVPIESRGNWPLPATQRMA